MQAPSWESRAAFAAPARAGRAPETPSAHPKGAHPDSRDSPSPVWSSGLNWEGWGAPTASTSSSKESWKCRLSRKTSRCNERGFLHLIPFPITHPCPWGKTRNITAASGISLHGSCTEGWALSCWEVAPRTPPALGKWHRGHPLPLSVLCPKPAMGTGTPGHWGHPPAACAGMSVLFPLLPAPSPIFPSEQPPNAFVLPQHR